MIDVEIIQKAMSMFQMTSEVYDEFFNGLQADENQTLAGMMHCLSVAGKPSQFVGEVTTYAQALEHRVQFELWKKTPDANLQYIKKDSELVKPFIEMLAEEFHDSVGEKRERLNEINLWKKREAERIRVTAQELATSWEQYVSSKRLLLSKAKRLA